MVTTTLFDIDRTFFLKCTVTTTLIHAQVISVCERNIIRHDECVVIVEQIFFNVVCIFFAFYSKKHVNPLPLSSIITRHSVLGYSKYVVAAHLMDCHQQTTQMIDECNDVTS